ncbi:MAG: outer membrane beta-barrel protein [Rhodobacter sp.]|nr:outer membrane beta-barrel protein [Rhodobacter sp.]
MSKQFFNLVSGCAIGLALSSLPAVAQESNWVYDLSFNLWFSDTAVSTDTPFGQVDAELSFSDAIQDLDFAFMGTVEARNGPWSVITDLLYFNLTADAPTPAGTLFSEVSMSSKITVLSGFLAYRVHQEPTFALDLGVGLRGFSTDLDTVLVGAHVPTASVNQTRDWIDPLVAARVRMAFSEDWFGTLLLDAGGTGDTSTWQALATVGYRLNDNWALQGGYRYLQSEWDTDLGQSSLEFSGPILGVTYRF